MEIYVFITPQERADLLNHLMASAGCQVFAASGNDDSYKPLAHIKAEDLEKNRHFEIGFLDDFGRLAGRPLKELYREDRVGFVTAYLPNTPDSFDVLLETNFRADPSPTALIIGKEIRKYLKRHAHQGVLVCTEGNDQRRISKNIHWTSKARESKKVWKQAESSVVYFVPAATVPSKPSTS